MAGTDLGSVRYWIVAICTCCGLAGGCGQPPPPTLPTAGTTPGRNGSAAAGFVAAERAGGRLKFQGPIPVLELAGTPKELGRQAGLLVGPEIKQLLRYPHEFLRVHRQQHLYPRIEQMAQQIWPQFPPDYQQELVAMAEAAGIDRQELIAANCLGDARQFFGCSSLVVEPSRSATGELLLGRNFDFEPLGLLDRYGAVMIFRPQGKRAFAAVGFAGMVGCYSAMNDVGLTLTLHEVRQTRDQSPPFDPRGVPMSICFRRVMEECATIDEAEALLRSLPATTYYNLAMADRQTAAVFEVTTRSVTRRNAVDGLVACTNHFRDPSLSVHTNCERYEQLLADTQAGPIGIEQLHQRLDRANQGRLTVQTMIFEPARLEVHLALGNPPSSTRSLTFLELGPLLRGSAPAEPR